MNRLINISRMRPFKQMLVGLGLLFMILPTKVFAQTPTSTPIPGAFAAVERSPDNTMLAGVGLGGIVRIYDLTSGMQIYDFEMSAERLIALSWSPDSRRIAVSGSEPYIYVLCVDQQIPAECTPGTLLTSIQAHEPYVLDVDWGPDGTRIASVNQQDQALSIWDADTYQLINTLYGGDPYKVDWNPNGTQLAVLDFMGYPWIVDASLDRSTKQTVGEGGPFGLPTYTLAWSPDGVYLAVGKGIPQSNEGLGRIEVWNTAQDLMIAQFQNLGDVVTTVAWSPDGNRLASYSTDRNVRVWDIASQQLLTTIPVAVGEPISSAAISWDASGNNVVFGGSEDILPVGLPTPVPTATFTATNTSVTTPTETPTATYTATASETLTPSPTASDTATYTPTATDTPTATLTPTYTPSATHTFTPTRTNTPSPTFTPQPATGWITFSSDRDGNNEIYTVNPSTGYVVRLTNHIGSDTHPVWSPNRTHIAFVSDRMGSNDIWVLEIANPANVFRVGIGNSLVNGQTTANDSWPAWSPDGTKLAFQSDRDGENEIYYVPIDSTGQSTGGVVKLTNNTAGDFEPSWDNASLRLVFTSNRDGNREIYKIHINTLVETRLTNNAAEDRHPVWSPVGSYVGFTSNRNVDGDYEIYYMSGGDGSGVTRLTNNSWNDQLVDWTPDSDINNDWFKIVYVSNQYGTKDLWVLFRNGNYVENEAISGAATNFQEDEPDW